MAIDFTPIDADPRVAPARAAYDQAVTRKNATAVANDAERVVQDARIVELRAQHTALFEAEQSARRRMFAARGQLTRARKTGDPERISAAEQKVAEAEARWEAAGRRFDLEGRPLIREMGDMVGAGLGRWGELMEHQKAEQEASDALWDARRQVASQYLGGDE